MFLIEGGRGFKEGVTFFQIEEKGGHNKVRGLQKMIKRQNLPLNYTNLDELGQF